MSSSAPRVMLFDLYEGGHHGQYIRHLAAYWVAHAMPGCLDIVVPRAFLERHQELYHFARQHTAAGIHLHPIEDPVNVWLNRPFQTMRNDLEHGRFLRRYVHKLRPDHCLFMLFDQTQLSLTLDLRFDFPVRFSGIYFRPSFHYPDLGGGAITLKDRLKGYLKKRLLRTALRNRHCDTLFCLDPFAVPIIQPMSTSVSVVPLPDGIEPNIPTTAPSALRADLGVATDRKLLLFFGAIDSRKGLLELLAALHLVPDAVCLQICLVIAGYVYEELREALHEALAALKQAKPVQVIFRDGFLPDSEVPDLIAASDAVLLPYQRHIGSSGVLIRAAAAQVPVMGSSYGLLGAWIRQRNLGLSIDTTDQRAMAEGVTRLITQPVSTYFDPAAALRFADEHTEAQFSKTIFNNLEKTTCLTSPT